MMLIARRPNMSYTSRSLHTAAGTLGVTLGYSPGSGGTSTRTVRKHGSSSSMDRT